MKLDREIEVAYSVSIHQLAAGKGEAALIIIKNDEEIVKSILLDSGFLKHNNIVVDALELHLDGTALTTVITTHYDGDHFRGISEVLKNHRKFINNDTRFFDGGVPFNDLEGTILYEGYRDNLLKISSIYAIEDVVRDEKITMDDYELNLFNELFMKVLKSIFNFKNSDFLIKTLQGISDEDNAPEYEHYLNKTIDNHDKKIREILNDKRSDELFKLIRKYFGKVIVAFSDRIHKVWPTLVEDKNYLVGKDVLNIEGKDAPTMKCYSINRAGGFERNNKSICLLLKLGEFSFYTAGDLESSIENEIVKEIQEEVGSLSVLKVSHHGSKHSTSKEFVESLKPVSALISCGNNNSHDHPELPVLKILSESSSLQRAYLTELGCRKHEHVVIENAKFLTAGKSKKSDREWKKDSERKWQNEPASWLVNYNQGADIFTVSNESADFEQNSDLVDFLPVSFISNLNFWADLKVDYEEIKRIEEASKSKRKKRRK